MRTATYRTRTRPQHLQERPAIDRRSPLIRLIDQAAERFETNVGRPILRPAGWQRDWSHWRNRYEGHLKQERDRLTRQRAMRKRYQR